jgi:hypothetical protein
MSQGSRNKKQSGKQLAVYSAALHIWNTATYELPPLSDWAVAAKAFIETGLRREFAKSCKYFRSVSPI